MRKKEKDGAHLSAPLIRRLVPDRMWEIAEPLIADTIKIRPQGGGRARLDERRAMAAICYILAGGVGWRSLPDVFGISVPTAYRRFYEWVNLALFAKILNSLPEDVDPELRGWLAMLVDQTEERGSKGKNQEDIRLDE